MTRQQRQQKDQRQGQGVSKSTAGHHQLPRACNGNIGGLEHGPVGAKAYSIVQAAAPVETPEAGSRNVANKTAGHHQLLCTCNGTVFSSAVTSLQNSPSLSCSLLVVALLQICTC